MNSISLANPQSMATSLTSPATTTSNDASGKKVRKPYTITKSRESWSDEEHDKFLEALQLFDRDWKKIEDFVGSKTVIQIRSHAQKYFLKVQKNGAVAHVPPPRPKRKATHPYPQKAPKIVLVPLQASVPHTSITTFTITPGLSQWDDSSVLLNAPSSSDMLNQDEFTHFPAIDGMNYFSDIGSKGTVGTDNNSDRTLPHADLPHTRKAPVLHGLPDFSKVYSFIGSVFDPDTEGQVHELKDMDPINFETVVSLMRNLTFNLSSPDFEPVEKILSSYDLNAQNRSVSFGVVVSDVCT